MAKKKRDFNGRFEVRGDKVTFFFPTKGSKVVGLMRGKNTSSLGHLLVRAIHHEQMTPEERDAADIEEQENATRL